MNYRFPSDENDCRSLTLTADEFQAALFMDSIIEEAKMIPPRVYQNPANWKNPVVELAYKINLNGVE